MNIFSITPDHSHSQNSENILELTRVYRKKHLWTIETDRDLIEEYRETDKTKYSFVALWNGSFAGQLGLNCLCQFNQMTAGMTQYDPELNRLRQVIVDGQFRKHGLGTKLGEHYQSVPK